MPKSKDEAMRAIVARVYEKARKLFPDAGGWPALAWGMALALLLAACACIPTAARAEVQPPAWQPAPGTSWQWQLQGQVDTSYDVDAYDVDGFDNDEATVGMIHARGSKAVCYISAGSWEAWRPDAPDFPDYVKGRNNGWPGEKWLDIRRTDVLEPIMGRRMDMCAAKGFDAVEPDNVDGYANNSGFPLTYEDQLAYNRMIAQLAHDRGMAVALKNDTDQVPDLVGDFDFAVVEECFRYKECPAYSPFVEAGKAVLAAEYSTTNRVTKCDRARQLRFSLIFKNRALGGGVGFC